jgi:carbamoyltransferase
MRNILNARVKHRESYRPFAPVVPVEAAKEVFELGVESPHMLLVAPVRPELRKILPAITHHDGTGRVQTVSRLEQPFLHSLCKRLKVVRGGPPVILNTSFNLAGEPIVETPADALRTFLATDIDHLVLDDVWVTKSRAEVKEYEDHFRDLPEATLPAGLAADAPSLEVEMAELDAALFRGAKQSAWTKSELRDISTRIGRYKEKSRTFHESEFGIPLRSVLGDGRLLLLDPLNGSELIQRDTGKVERLDMRTVGRLLGRSDRTQPRRLENETIEAETSMTDGTLGTFAAYADVDYAAPPGVHELGRRLREAGYVESEVCERLGKNPQELEPTDLPYLDRFALGSGDLEDLLRLFQLRANIGEDRARSLLGSEGYEFLLDQGALSSEGGLVSARIDLFPVGELVVATDHRYQILESDKLSEDPVMYLGLDSVGLVNTAPRVDVGSHLDLCTGSGVQALVAASYSDYVVGVDLNPRAIRFSRFNADFNGIDHVDFRLGSLYEPVADEQFDSITANPPFVPSPDDSLGFRDGGRNGEAILSCIVQGAGEKLRANGRLSIVTDLVDPDQYIEKISNWWSGGAICGLILTTADRDEALFSVPHARAPFGQSYEEYSEELSRWVNSYRSASLGTVNFGYILLQENSEAGVENHIVQRVVSSPMDPIYDQARELVNLLVSDTEDNLGRFEFTPAPGLRVQTERRLDGSTLKNEILVPDNPWFTRYRLEANLLGLLEEAGASPLSWANIGERGLLQQARALVEKGLLVGRLRQDAPPAVCGLPRAEVWPPCRIVIDELATKTTPTCVSNYLQ